MRLELRAAGALRARIRSRELFQCGVFDPGERLSPARPRPRHTNSCRHGIVGAGQHMSSAAASAEAGTGRRSWVEKSWGAANKGEPRGLGGVVRDSSEGGGERGRLSLGLASYLSHSIPWQAWVRYLIISA